MKHFFYVFSMTAALAGCAQTPKDLKSQQPIVSVTVSRNWESLSNCVVSYLDDNMRFGAFGFAPDNSLRMNSQNKQAEIVSKHSGSMISTMKIKGLSSSSRVEAYASGYQMHVYTGSLKKYLADAVNACGK
jgi:starvation-inducible outer membrane lipoprotein